MYTIFNSRNPSFWLFLSASGHNFERETIASGGRGFIIVVKKIRGWKFLLNFEIIAIVCLSREEFKPSEIGIAIPTVSFVFFSKEEKKEIFSFFLCPLHRRDLWKDQKHIGILLVFYWYFTTTDEENASLFQAFRIEGIIFCSFDHFAFEIFIFPSRRDRVYNKANLSGVKSQERNARRV